MVIDEKTISEEILNGEVLLLEKISTGPLFQKNLGVFKKRLIELSIPIEILRNISNMQLIYGTVITCQLSPGRKNDKYSVHSVTKMTQLLKTPELSIDYDKNLNRYILLCNALTNGCFTYQNLEFSYPAVFNDVLGIIMDKKVMRTLPQKEIGRLSCSVITERIDGIWRFVIEKLHSFEKVYSLSMSARIKSNEHYGLVTREECDDKRDLRLVSCRDFARDVRIFRKSSHCCELLTDTVHEHKKCIDAGVGDVRLLGKSLAIKLKRCHGMMTNNNYNETSFESAESHHVDGKSLRSNVSQMSVNVHGGFVEIETISEYSGLTDHSGYPLLWSHDVEFVVDFSKIFHERPFGLYIVKVVRFHRANVFAKWRLARRSPIMKSLQTKFHSRLTHSLSVATLGIGNDEKSKEYRFSVRECRFGSFYESCCLPRTDALDNLQLFDAIFKNSPETSSLVNKKLVFEEDSQMWEHHDNSVLKIVDGE